MLAKVLLILPVEDREGSFGAAASLARVDTAAADAAAHPVVGVDVGFVEGRGVEPASGSDDPPGHAFVVFGGVGPLGVADVAVDVGHGSRCLPAAAGISGTAGKAASGATVSARCVLAQRRARRSVRSPRRLARQ